MITLYVKQLQLWLWVNAAQKSYCTKENFETLRVLLMCSKASNSVPSIQDAVHHVPHRANRAAVNNSNSSSSNSSSSKDYHRKYSNKCKVKWWQFNKRCKYLCSYKLFKAVSSSHNRVVHSTQGAVPHVHQNAVSPAVKVSSNSSNPWWWRNQLCYSPLWCNHKCNNKMHAQDSFLVVLVHVHQLVDNHVAATRLWEVLVEKEAKFRSILKDHTAKESLRNSKCFLDASAWEREIHLDVRINSEDFCICLLSSLQIVG